MLAERVVVTRPLVYADYDRALRPLIDWVPVRRFVRGRLLSYGRHLYRVYRHVGVEEGLDEFAASALRAGAERVHGGLKPAAVARAFAVSCKLLTGRCPERLKQLAVSYLKQWEDKGGNMSDECRMSNDECPTDKGKKTKGRRLAKSASDPLSRMQDEPSPVEQTARKYAARHLRQAMVPMLPLERQCVIARLARRMSFDAIAHELDVTREEVLDVLARARSRIQSYTTYFNNSWYWRDGPASADAV